MMKQNEQYISRIMNIYGHYICAEGQYFFISLLFLTGIVLRRHNDCYIMSPSWAHNTTPSASYTIMYDIGSLFSTEFLPSNITHIAMDPHVRFSQCSSPLAIQRHSTGLRIIHLNIHSPHPLTGTVLPFRFPVPASHPQVCPPFSLARSPFSNLSVSFSNA